MANQQQHETTSSKKREKHNETRSQFEHRMKKELQDLFNSRMAELLKGQMEATRMTVEAAEKLANLKDHHHHRHSSSKHYRLGKISSPIILPQETSTCFIQFFVCFSRHLGLI